MRKRLYIFYGSLVVLAALCLILGKVRVLGAHFIFQHGEPGISYGDLYSMAEVERFKARIPIFENTATTTIEQAKIFTLGDSFFQTTHQSPNLGLQLQEKLGVPVYNVVQASQDFLDVANPLVFLQNNRIDTATRKILILETVDRRSLARAEHYLNTSKEQYPWLKFIKERIFNNGDVEYFVRDNILVSPIRKAIKNWEYEYLGEIDPRIGAHDPESLMLFYFEEIGFAKQVKTDAEISAAARQIQKLKDLVLEKYNLDLIYINMPSKFAFYGYLADKDFRYDGFAHRFQKELTSLGVVSIDAYQLFKDHEADHPNDHLYYPSDTHYTALGKQLVVEAIVAEVEKMNK